MKDTTYLDICTKMLEEDFVARGYNVYNTTLEKQVFPTLYEVYAMLWHVHPLFENCYLAPDTATDIIFERFNDAYDVKVILTNIVHNVSYVVDTYEDVKDFFLTTERGQGFEGPYEAGYGIGRLVYYLIADNELAKQVDPAEGMDLPEYFGGEPA